MGPPGSWGGGASLDDPQPRELLGSLYLLNRAWLGGAAQPYLILHYVPKVGVLVEAPT